MPNITDVNMNMMLCSFVYLFQQALTLSIQYGFMIVTLVVGLNKVDSLCWPP